jgi:hypothetical protein
MRRMEDTDPTAWILTAVPVTAVTNLYTAEHRLDPAHTTAWALARARKMLPNLARAHDDDWQLSLAGVMRLVTMLDTARVMGRLRRTDGATGYRP